MDEQRRKSCQYVSSKNKIVLVRTNIWSACVVWGGDVICHPVKITSKHNFTDTEREVKNIWKFYGALTLGCDQETHFQRAVNDLSKQCDIPVVNNIIFYNLDCLGLLSWKGNTGQTPNFWYLLKSSFYIKFNSMFYVLTIVSLNIKSENASPRKGNFGGTIQFKN